MTPCLRLLALWLAASWLPLTMHCQLAGLRICCPLGSCCEQGACGEDATGCHDPACCGKASERHAGGCEIVEDGNYFLGKSALAVPAATVAVIPAPALPDGSRPLPLVAALTEATGAPPGWARVWQFVLRAAPGPRAPSARC
ncbi:MAG: hypothetical protein DVB25_07710 [Verrucomicrobia bacterium]|nr:MAG: hypothetical protein DVB25_07710 [Verrucomicrobiota bacterium]